MKKITIAIFFSYLSFNASAFTGEQMLNSCTTLRTRIVGITNIIKDNSEIATSVYNESLIRIPQVNMFISLGVLLSGVALSPLLPFGLVAANALLITQSQSLESKDRHVFSGGARNLNEVYERRKAVLEEIEKARIKESGFLFSAMSAQSNVVRRLIALNKTFIEERRILLGIYSACFDLRDIYSLRIDDNQRESALYKKIQDFNQRANDYGYVQ